MITALILLSVFSLMVSVFMFCKFDDLKHDWVHFHKSFMSEATKYEDAVKKINQLEGKVEELRTVVEFMKGKR